MIDFLIDRIALQQIVMGVKSIDPSVVQYKDPVCGLYTGNTLGNNDLGSSWDLFSKSGPDTGVSCRIYRTGGVIQDQDLRFLQKGSGNTQTLLLTSGNISAAPGNIGMISIRHPVDKFIGAGCLTCLYTL